MINLLWDAVATVVTHSTSVPQTYPPCPQHTHSNLAHVHSTTESWLSIALLSCCGSYLNVWRLAFYQKTILLLTKCSNRGGQNWEIDLILTSNVRTQFLFPESWELENRPQSEF